VSTVGPKGLGRLLTLLLIPVSVCAPIPVRAQTSSPYALPSDPTLDRLISESLSARPEIVGAVATIRAQRTRVPQAGAWPDPMVQFGVQNNGFTSWEVGRMETSYYSVMVSQTFPWPGKSGLQSDIAELGVGQSKLGVTRLRLSTEADVRRLYVGLLLVRDRIALLDRVTSLGEKSTEVARFVYEAGGGSQSDLLRSRLELHRLKQWRLALTAEECTLVQGLNRLRGRPLDELIETKIHLVDLGMGMPGLFEEKQAIDDALARSPELAALRISISAAGKSVDLANRNYFPDLVVSAGIMPRGGDFAPMWLLSVGGTIPVFAGSKQNRAVEEGEARATAARANVDGMEQLLRLRVRERLTSLAALLDTLGVYNDGLLVESRATAESALTQYQVGKVSFASVLDANAGVLADEDGYLQTLAAANQLVIAGYELNLNPVATSAGSAMGSTAMPGQGFTSAAPNYSTASGGSASDADRSTSGGCERRTNYAN